jgi:hypothetical protein
VVLCGKNQCQRVFRRLEEDVNITSIGALDSISPTSIIFTIVSMTLIQDSGSIFEAPLEMVWKSAKDHVEHGNKIHPKTRNDKTEIIINTWEQDDENGQNHQNEGKRVILLSFRDCI